MTANSTALACYRGTRVLVLGASGFIGRWVARALCVQGADVYMGVRNTTTAAAIFGRYRVSGTFSGIDLSDAAGLWDALRSLQPSITFNLGGYGVDPSERDREMAYRINAAAVEVICRAMARNRDPMWPGPAVVHVGSALEYGDIGGDLDEGSAPKPTTLYGRSKLAGTTALVQTCQARRVPGLVARLFTVFGPGEHSGRLLPSLMRTANSGQALRLTRGRQRRDFAYVETVAEGLLRLGTTPARCGEVVNLATGRLTSVRNFIETAARIIGIPDQQLQFGALPVRAQEMEHAEVATHRLRQLTAWAPDADIGSGIRRTLAFERGANENAP